MTVSRMLTFSGGVTRLTVPVTIVDDGDIELTEEFVANITLVTTDLDISTTPGQTTVVITDNDGRSEQHRALMALIYYTVEPL